MFYRIITAFFVLAIITGCASFDAITQKNRQQLNQLSIGMTKQEVMGVMGTESVKTGGRPSVITNPYRTEVFKGQSGNTYEILFYYTDLKSRDGVISDDELTPIVLENGKVVGWGNTFFSDVKRLEIRMR